MEKVLGLCETRRWPNPGMPGDRSMAGRVRQEHASDHRIIAGPHSNRGLDRDDVCFHMAENLLSIPPGSTCRDFPSASQEKQMKSFSYWIRPHPKKAKFTTEDRRMRQRELRSLLAMGKLMHFPSCPSWFMNMGFWEGFELVAQFITRSFHLKSLNQRDFCSFAPQRGIQPSVGSAVRPSPGKGNALVSPQLA